MVRSISWSKPEGCRFEESSLWCAWQFRALLRDRPVPPQTNAIESVNARIRKAVKARGHFPNEQAALKCVYLAVMSLDPTGRGRQRWSNRWEGALNAFTIAFPDRMIPSTK